MVGVIDERLAGVERDHGIITILMGEGNVSHGTIRRDRGTHVQIQILHRRYGRVWLLYQD
jgi:DeoR/GlpR family transcriptional regulator of sugar metabolism